MMIKRGSIRIFLIIGLCLNFIGCAPSSNEIVKPFADLQYGMTKQQMIALMGKPNTIEIYKKTDQTRVEFYIYANNYQSPPAMVPVCLINNKVVGWGKSFYEDHVSQDDIRIR